MTPFIMSTIMYAILGSRTFALTVSFCSMTFPSLSVTLMIDKGCALNPPVANAKTLAEFKADVLAAQKAAPLPVVAPIPVQRVK